MILAILGVLQLSHYLSASTHVSGKVTLALVGSALLAIVMGAVRALTVSVWRGNDGQLLRKGTWLTGVLWVVAVAAHLGLDEWVAGSGSSKSGSVADASILLYLAVSFGVQQAVLLRRAQLQEAAGQVPSSEPHTPVL